MAFAAIAIIFSSCEPTSFNETYLYGYWQDDNNADHYKRFLTSSEDDTAVVALKSQTYNCTFGYDWDESEQTEEDDLFGTGYHGIGWYKWNLSASTLALFEQGEKTKDLPYLYKVKKLTSKQLQIVRNNVTETYTKVDRTPHPITK